MFLTTYKTHLIKNCTFYYISNFLNYIFNKVVNKYSTKNTCIVLNTINFVLYNFF